MAEERETPMLDELVTEIDATIARLDAPGAAAAANPMDEIRNTILPLMKDLAASTMAGLMYVQDLAEPIELTGGEAEEIATLLKAMAGANPLDKALQERIAQALEPLEDEDDEDGDDEDEETN